MTPVLLLLALAAASDETPSLPVELHLVCPGTGSVTRGSSGTATALDNNGNSAVVTSTVNGAVGFQGVMRIDIVGGEGQIRVPAVMLPEIRGGKNGVMQLKNVQISESEITARVAYNIINKPRIVIDRLSGAVSLDDRMTGAQFAGRCEAFDPAKEKRAF